MSTVADQVELSPVQKQWRARFLRVMREKSATSEKVETGPATETELDEIQRTESTFSRSVYDDVRDKVDAIIKEHEKQIPAESQAFFNKSTIDEVFVIAAAIDDPEERVKAFRAMNAARMEAENRKWQLGIELKKVETASLQNNVADTAAFNNAMTVAAGMLDHIPEEFVSQPEKFADRLHTLSLGDKEKGELKNQTEVELGEKKDAERQVFEDVIGKRGTKELARLDSFDPVMTYISIDEQNKITAALNAAMKRAHQIRDCGGTLEEAERQLEHIPRTWWPAEFVKELQAWRKVERAMRQEAVDKMMQEAMGEIEKAEEKEGNKLETGAKVTSILNKIYGGGSTASQLDVTVPIVGLHIKTFPNEARKEVDGYITSALTELTTLLEAGGATAEIVETIRKEGLEGLKPKDKEEVITKVASFSKKIYEATEAAGKFSKEAEEALKHAIPGMLIAVGLAELAKAIAEHQVERSKREDTSSMMARAMGDMDDGGAMVNSMLNEVGARQRLMDQRRVEMIQAGVKVAKGAADLAGPHGKAVSAGISIVGTSIEYGGKVYFANVDFNQARAAKQTLLRAQAGSTVDRLLVFENCAVYAKMYIAILAKEKNKLAEEFIIKRGYNDADIAKEEVNATILREFLMKDAGQVDERETTDSRAVAIGEGLAGITLKEGKGYLEKVSNFKETYFPAGLEGVSPSSYDPSWSHKIEEVAIDPEKFKSTWKRAVDEAGLFDDGTVPPPALASAKKVLEDFGVRDALTLEGLRTAIAAAETNPRSPLRQKDRLTDAVKAFRAAGAALCEVQPMHTPDGEKQQVGEHFGFGKYILAQVKMLSAMESMITARLQGFSDESCKAKAETVWLCDPQGKPLPADKLMDTTWKHSSCALTVANWTDNRTAALRLAWREDEISKDPGVSAAIAKVVAASGSKDLSKPKSDPAWRKSRIAWRSALESLLSELDKYWGECEHDGLRAYITEMKLLAAEQLRRLDSELYPSMQDFPLEEVNGENVTVDKKFTSAAWKKAYNSSLGNFDDDIGDAKKLHEALQAWEKSKGGLEGKSGQELRTARLAVIEALKNIGLSAAAAGRVVGTPALVKYLQFMASHAQKLLAEQLAAHRGTTFDYQQAQSFQKDSWLAAYNEAIRVGAVPEAKGPAGKLGTAIETAHADYLAVVKGSSAAGGKCNKEVRAAVEKLSKSLVEVRQAVGKLRAENGYMDHPQMNACLDIIQDAADRLGETNVVTQILQGAGAEFGKYKFQWETSHWDLTVKRAAIDAGLLPENARTGLSAAISTVVEKNRAVLELLGPRGGRSGTGNVDERAKELTLLREYKEACEKLIKLATAQKAQVNNKNYQDYMDDGIENARDYLTLFRDQSDAVSFKCPAKLIYTNEDWQGNKKLAVAAGVLPNVRTNLGTFITASAEAYKAFLDAKNADSPDEDELRAKRITARASLGQMIKQINKLKNTYKDGQFAHYLDLWINEVKNRWKHLAS